MLLSKTQELVNSSVIDQYV